MKEAAKQLEFERAAALRDEVVQLRGIQVLQHGPEAAFSAEPKMAKRVIRRRRGI
jgi:excinuclease UvrABC nuclease subunit